MSSGTFPATPSQFRHRSVALTTSADVRLQIILERILRSNLLSANRLEPTIPSHSQRRFYQAAIGEDPTLGIDLGLVDYSVYTAFLQQVGPKEWSCLFDCDRTESFDRLARALHHVRVHFNHRPFGCPGQCGDVHWYLPERSSLETTLTFQLQ